jgi:hypothetical protein
MAEMISPVDFESMPDIWEEKGVYKGYINCTDLACSMLMIKVDLLRSVGCSVRMQTMDYSVTSSLMLPAEICLLFTSVMHYRKLTTSL